MGAAAPIGPGPSTDGMAIGALVLGLLSFCLGCLTGIPAIILGMISIKRINADPANKGGKGMAIAGVVLGAILTVLAIIGLIVWGVGMIVAQQAGSDILSEFQQNLDLNTTVTTDSTVSTDADFQALFDAASGTDLQYLTGTFSGPASVSLGDQFLVVLSLTNSKGSPLPLDSIDVHDEYLTGIEIVTSSPPSTIAPFHIPVDNSMSYSMKTVIPAQGSKEVTFTCKANQRGTFSANFDVCITYSDCVKVLVTTAVN